MISREKESETPPFFPDVSEDVCHVSSAPKGVTQLSLECWFGALIGQLVKGAHCVPKPSLQIIFKYVQVRILDIGAVSQFLQHNSSFSRKKGEIRQN